MSVLEWKTRWPQAGVICFEPDPFAFQVLQTNVDQNDIPGIKCFNAAVSDCDGTADFYGDLSQTSDARGNSLDPNWADRHGSSQTTVECMRLSTVIGKQDVAFLKLDIEGAEQRVLEEIAGCLSQIQAIYVEVHETDQGKTHNSLQAVETILGDAGFTIEKRTVRRTRVARTS